MGERDQLITAVLARLDRVNATEDFAPVHEAAALAEARRLAEIAEGNPADLRAIHVLGGLYWYRYCGYRQRGHQELQVRDDLDAAIGALTKCFIAGVEDLPEELLPLLAKRAAPTADALTGSLLRAEADRDQIFAAANLWLRIVASIPAADPERSSCLSNLSIALLCRAELTRARDDADAAVDAARSAIAMAPAGLPGHDRAMILANLANALRVRAEVTGAAADLDEAADIGQAAVAITGDHPNRAGQLFILASVLHARFIRAKADADLYAAVRAYRALVSDTRAAQLIRTVTMSRLGALLQIRFEQTGAPADLDAAIEADRAALDGGPVGPTNRYALLSNLGVVLRYRFDRTGDPADLDAAIDALEAAALTSPADYPHHAEYQFKLGLARQTRFGRTGSADDLDIAIAAYRKALEVARAGFQNRAPLLSSLGAALLTRFMRTSEPADLDAAVEMCQAALDAAPSSHPERAFMLSNLGSSSVTRFVHAGHQADLATAVSACQQAVATAREADHRRPTYLSNLGHTLQIRFQQTGDLADLDAAISATKSAVGMTPVGHPDGALRLANLGGALLARFDRYGELSDLDAAIEASQAAVAATPVGHPDRGAMLASLGKELYRRSYRTGDLRDLDAAVEVGRATIAEPASASHSDRGMYLNDLGSTLRQRFERTGALADLDAAIKAGRSAVAAAAIGQLNRSVFVSNLSISLRDRYARTGTVGDLDEAIETSQAAVDLTPAGHPDRPGHVSNLANLLHIRFRRTGTLADLDRAIDTVRAVPGMPAGHLGRASRLAVMAHALLDRYATTAKRSDLDAALGDASAAVAQTPLGHANRAYHLTVLGFALYLRYRLDGSPADYEAACSGLEEAAAACPQAAPTVRIRAAVFGAAILGAHSDTGRAADLLEQAVLLLPEAAPLQLERSDQQYALGSLTGLASDAAALALADAGVEANSGASAAARATRALRLLEVGRAVLLGQALNTRTDLTDLGQRDSALAARFVAVRDLLDRSPADEAAKETAEKAATPGPAGAGPLSRDRNKLAAEFRGILDRIRALDGFATFGLPPSAGELLAEAALGPVVACVTGAFGCYALLLTRDGISPVELPGLTVADLTSQVLSFHAAVRATTSLEATAQDRDAARATMCEILAWLWDTTAGPVLQALGYDHEPPADQEWPRVWWAPGGLLSLLPLHAAGHHRTGRGRAVMDRVVSSYTPTIRALRHSRQRTRAAASIPDRSLIVAMPTTPGLPGGALPGVYAEVSRIRAILPNPVVLSEAGLGPSPGTRADDLPTKANVLAQLPACSIAHFACHGASDPGDPSKSLLLLRDHETDPFTVASLTPVNLNNARLAYLSACQTAAVAANGLIDEAIHLATAFQLAGVPSVVGTLWEITEPAAAAIAAAFYAGLRTDQGALDTGNAARALHHAIRVRRDRNPAQPFLWAGYLHAGA